MSDLDDQQEVIWRQIIELIETEEMFIPWKVEQRISPEAHEIFKKYLAIMIESGMLVEFRSQSLMNKFTFWMLKQKFKNHENRDELLNLFVKGPKWDTYKSLSFTQIGGDIEGTEEKITH